MNVSHDFKRDDIFNNMNYGNPVKVILKILLVIFFKSEIE